MKKALLLILLLFFLLAAMMMTMKAEVNEYTTEDGFRYRLDKEKKTAELARYEGTESELVIPGQVAHRGVTYDVTRLGQSCFYNCHTLTSVVLPPTVRTLGEECFSGCVVLASVNIPPSVSQIGDGCFAFCSSLTAVAIPASVKEVRKGCFRGCASLTEITVDKANRVYDSREDCNAIIETATNTMVAGCGRTTIPASVTRLADGCFADCSSLMSVAIPPTVSDIGRGCFAGCTSLASVSIPPSVMSIGEECFFGCTSLKAVFIGASVRSIGYASFAKSALETIAVDKENKVYDSREDCNAIIQTSTNTMVAGCGGTTIPATVTRLADGCFLGSPTIVTITIPPSVTEIGNYCFSNCQNLDAIDIPPSVRSIGDNCFAWCASLAVVSIPSSVTHIGTDCFAHCTLLHTVRCLMPTAREGSFFNATQIEKATLHVPCAALASYKQTEPWKGFGAILPSE